MENSKITQGGDLMLFAKIKDPAKSGTEKTVTLAFATSHKLSVNAETAEVTNKDHGGGTWKSSTVKKLSWSVSSENLFIEKSDKDTENQKAFGDLFKLMTDKTEIEVMLAPVSNKAEVIPSSGWTPDTTGTYSGKVIITSLELNAPSGDNATYSVSLEGVGALTHNAGAAA